MLPRVLFILQVVLALYGLWGLILPNREVRAVSEPPGAVAIIDGWFIEETPFVRELPVRSHRVVFRASGFQEEVITVPKGTEPVLVRAQLKMRRPPWNDASWKGGRASAE